MRAIDRAAHVGNKGFLHTPFLSFVGVVDLSLVSLQSFVKQSNSRLPGEQPRRKGKQRSDDGIEEQFCVI